MFIVNIADLMSYFDKDKQKVSLKQIMFIPLSALFLNTMEVKWNGKNCTNVQHTVNVCGCLQ